LWEPRHRKNRPGLGPKFKKEVSSKGNPGGDERPRASPGDGQKGFVRRRARARGGGEGHKPKEERKTSQIRDRCVKRIRSLLKWISGPNQGPRPLNMGIGADEELEFTKGERGCEMKLTFSACPAAI